MAPLGEGRELIIVSNISGKSVSDGWLIILLYLSDGLANSVAYEFVLFYLESIEACRRELERGMWLVGYRRQGGYGQ